MTVKEGDKIKVEYEGKLEDGTVFDSSEKQGKPLEFQVGSKQVIKGFEEGVVGMEKGQEKEITLKPSEAYGDYNPELVKKVPKDQLPKDKEPQKDMMLLLSLPNGAQIPAKITEVTDKDVTLDLNHPLVGKTLVFNVKVVDISS
jgi:FKBP-type peptidyl-prolyl cis-trans isomerase 2